MSWQTALALVILFGIMLAACWPEVQLFLIKREEEKMRLEKAKQLFKARQIARAMKENGHAASPAPVVVAPPVGMAERDSSIECPPMERSIYTEHSGYRFICDSYGNVLDVAHPPKYTANSYI